MIQFQGRTPEILPVSDYNDQLGEVYLQNPTNFSKRRLTYEEFKTAWSKNSQSKCVLITPQKLTETDLQNVLGKIFTGRGIPAAGQHQKSLTSILPIRLIFWTHRVFLLHGASCFVDVLKTARTTTGHTNIAQFLVMESIEGDVNEIESIIVRPIA